MEKFKCNWSKMFESILWCDGCCTESLCTREPLSCKLIDPDLGMLGELGETPRGGEFGIAAVDSRGDDAV